MADVCEASDEDEQQLGLITNNNKQQSKKKPWWLRNLFRRWVDVLRQKVLGSGGCKRSPRLWWARLPSPEQQQQRRRRRWHLHMPTKVRFRVGVVGGGGGGHRRKVPKGFLPVYVGQQHQRFVIPIFYLTHPLFESLLDRAAQEYEFQHQGALLIPCEVPAFELLSSCIQTTNQTKHARA